MGLAGALGHLRCPHCAAGLSLAGGSVHCANGHSFDVARQGYVNLAPSGGPPLRGDTTAMVTARDEFLAAGHYDPITRAVADAVADLATSVDGAVADLGAGTGHHLAGVLDRVQGRAGLALDSSRFALRRAARAHARIAAVACDAWRALPLRDATAAAVLSVFAPRGGEEIARVLAPGGALVLVAPTMRHLAELVEPLGLLHVDARKEERIDAALGGHLERERGHENEFAMRLDRRAVRALAGMGPSAHHLAGDALEERLAALPDPVAVTASVTVSVLRRG